MRNETQLDSFLEKRLTKHDQWMAKGQISYSSEVISVSESLDAKQWVMPTEQVIQVLESAESIALGDCEERCPFGARISQEATLQYDTGKCVGCGLCVTTCPVEAIAMVIR